VSANTLMSVCVGGRVLRGPVPEANVGPGRCPQMTDEWIVNWTAILSDRSDGSAPVAVVEMHMRVDEAKQLAGALDAAIRITEELNLERQHLLERAKAYKTGGGA
jgi:hypothetical protein